eukprot:gene26814-biopygen17403
MDDQSARIKRTDLFRKDPQLAPNLSSGLVPIARDRQLRFQLDS